MNHPQNIDWPGIRANAVLIGVREAARQAAVNLPPDEQNRFVKRVLKRSERQGWITSKTALQASIPSPNASGHPPTPAKPMSSNVVMSSDAGANYLVDLGKRTKLGLMTAAGKAADAFADRTGENVIKGSKALRDITAAASQLHGWEDKRNAGLALNVAVMIGSVD